MRRAPERRGGALLPALVLLAAAALAPRRARALTQDADGTLPPFLFASPCRFRCARWAGRFGPSRALLGCFQFPGEFWLIGGSGEAKQGMIPPILWRACHATPRPEKFHSAILRRAVKSCRWRRRQLTSGHPPLFSVDRFSTSTLVVNTFCSSRVGQCHAPIDAVRRRHL
jgi:hypothetical protein